MTNQNVEVISFTAEWCGPCSNQHETFEETDEFDVTFYDVENNVAMANEYSVRSVPTTIILEDGDPVSQYTGYTSSDVIAEELSELEE